MSKQKNQASKASPEALKESHARAAAVEAITETPGWRILVEDMILWKDRLASQIIYLDPESPEFRSARVLATALNQIPILIAQYSSVKDQIEEDLNAINNESVSIPKYWDNH